MTRQTWTAVASATWFVLLAVVLAFTPIDYVAWHPGSTVNVLSAPDGRPVLDVAGARTYATTGQLRLTTVSVTAVDGRLSLPEALLAQALPGRDVLPRSVVYPPGETSEESRAEDRRMMDDSQDASVVAALREAGTPVTEMPVISSVTINGPADQHLEPGDLVSAVDDTPVHTPAEVQSAVQRVTPGDPIVFRVLRNGSPVTETVTTAASNSDPNVPVVGITVGIGYRYEMNVQFNIDPRIGGSSAGMIFALGIYDRITPGDLLRGRVVAGTGTITPDGAVGVIGGVREKAKAAERSGAEIFVFPRGNCSEMSGFSTQLTLVPVDSLDDAVVALSQPRPEVAQCP